MYLVIVWAKYTIKQTNLNTMKTVKYAFTLPTPKTAYISTSVVPVCKNSSFSPIIALATHLIHTHPTLHPPTHLPSQSHIYENKYQLKSPTKQKLFHPFHQIWIDYIVQCVVEGRARVGKGCFYVDLPVYGEQEEKLKASVKEGVLELKELPAQLYEETFSSNRLVQHIFSLPYKLTLTKFAYLQTHKITPTPNPQTPKLNKPALLIGNLFNNQQWTIYKLLQDQIPTIQELKQFQSVILPGSPNSVLQLDHAISKMRQNLMTVWEGGKLKILAICYGHQLISQYFKAPLQRKQLLYGTQQIHLNQTQLQKHPFLAPLHTHKTLTLSQIHQDFVLEIPQDFTLLASSPSCHIEMLLHKNCRILTTQFHAEYIYDYVRDYQNRNSEYWGVDKTRYVVRGTGNESEIDRKEIQDKNARDSEVVLECFRNFVNL